MNDSIIQITVADPASQDARTCFDHYYAELRERFEAGYNPTMSLAVHSQELTPPAGLLLIAYLHEEPVGCGAVKFHQDAVGEIKRVWVSPQVRGQGLGRRLLQRLEDEARKAGMTAVHLDTNRALTEAIALYRRSGYREIEAYNNEPYAHYWFEKHL